MTVTLGKHLGVNMMKIHYIIKRRHIKEKDDRVEASWVFPIYFSNPLVSSLFYSCLGNHVGETLWVYPLVLLVDTLSQQTL